ncbi:MAG: class I SAM-dependent methyltransferase [Acidobacteria bacterium]|nr:class I SAM-dependent methyltransferase [Acidobacteriota bacterium]
MTELLFELSAYASQDPELSLYSGARLTLRRCTDCGFAQPEAVPGLPRYFDRMYDQRWSEDWIHQEFEGQDKDAIFWSVLRELARRLPGDRRRLLDVGAHAGRFVTLARAAGWRAEGLELNPQTAAYAARRSGAPIRQLNVHDVDASAQYDAVTLTDVLEHIPDPVGVLARVAELLAPGGWVSVKVPCGSAQLIKERWRGRLRPGYRPTVADNLVHVSHFSPRSLHRALVRAGFGSIRIGPAVPELPAGDGLACVASRTVRMALYHAARLLPGGVHAPFAFNLQAYGRRT